MEEALFAGVEEERSRVCLLMCVRARVRAPAMEVVGVEVKEEARVVVRREVREERRASEMRRKGRYLLASSVGWMVLDRGSETGRPLEGPFRVRERFEGGPVSDISVSKLWLEPFWWDGWAKVDTG